MGQFRQILEELSAQDTPIFSFTDDNFSKYKGILMELDTGIDTKKIWFGIAKRQISSIFVGLICPRHAHIFVFGQYWVNIKGF